MHNHWTFGVADRVRKRWGALGLLASVFLALAPLKNSVVDPKFPAWMYGAFLWSALAIFLLIAIAWGLCILGSYLERDVVEKFECASRGEIQEVVPFYDRVIGTGQRPSVNQLKSMFSANKSIFRFYKRKSVRGSRKIVEIRGFCTVIPMKRDAGVLLEKGELNGLKMDSTHIAGAKERCEVCYIGSIGAERNSAKAAVLTYVLGVIDEYEQRGCGRVYTRPTTEDGLRIVRKYGFVSVEGGGVPRIGELCYKELGDGQVRRRPVRVRRQSVGPLVDAAVAA